MSIIKLEDITEREIIPGFNGKFIHSENVTIIYWRILAGSQLTEHNHMHEQITNIINGEFEFIIEGETKRLTSGEVAIITSNVKHSGRAITDCNIIDVFYPTRDDYKIELKKNNDL